MEEYATNRIYQIAPMRHKIWASFLGMLITRAIILALGTQSSRVVEEIRGRSISRTGNSTRQLEINQKRPYDRHFCVSRKRLLGARGWDTIGSTWGCRSIVHLELKKQGRKQTQRRSIA